MSFVARVLLFVVAVVVGVVIAARVVVFLLPELRAHLKQSLRMGLTASD